MVKIKAIVLAAGYATRLWPLTKNKPKPLLEVAGKPMVEHTLSKIEKIDEIDSIFIVTNNKFYSNFVSWLNNYKSKKLLNSKNSKGLENSSNFQKEIKIVNDKTMSNEDRLGAIGDIVFVIKEERVNDDILVIAGDNLFEFSLLDIIKLFKEKRTIIVALYDVKDKELAKKYGIVAIDKENKIIDFKEKPSEPKSTLASTGIYIYPKKSIEYIFQYIKNNPADKTGSLLEWLYKKQPIYCYIPDKKWYDIGSFEQLNEARKKYKA